MKNMNREQGQPGEPGRSGEEGRGKHGGKGGEGGRGGAGGKGDPEGVGGGGGKGGGGGVGAPGKQGEPGERGERGPTNRLAVLGYVFLTLGMIAGLYWSHSNAQDICFNAKDNRQILRMLIASGDPQNIQPGQPGYDYYRSHPKERQAAHTRTQRILKETVPTIEC
jgi:hypothetical protein